MSSPRRRHLVVEARRDRAAASSEGASLSSNANHSWGLAHSRHETPGEPQHYGYAATVPSVPLPSANSASIPDEAYPLQSELSQNHRVLHTHIFKEVIPPPGSGKPSRLMITEVDRYGVERNRQAEFFFNGIVGHVCSSDGGRINSWEQATRLANYWRRFYNIPEVHDGNTAWNSSWQDYQQSSDNAENTGQEQPESDMEDDTSVNVETGQLPIPSQVHQLASVLHNILISDREYNAPILEKLADPNANPIQLFTASDLAHLSSHVAITAQTLAQHALRTKNSRTSRTSPTRRSKSCTSTSEGDGNSFLVTGLLISKSDTS